LRHAFAELVILFFNRFHAGRLVFSRQPPLRQRQAAALYYLSPPPPLSITIVPEAPPMPPTLLNISISHRRSRLLAASPLFRYCQLLKPRFSEFLAAY